MAGEDLHKLGEEGVRRAKKWLDATTRVSATWSVYDDVVTSRLEYDWPHGGKKFSFDMGGLLFGGEFHQQAFLAECKKYSHDNQGGHFDKFLAQSYVTLRDDPRMANHFMWITWNPFRIKSWQKNASAASIIDALKVEGLRVFGSVDHHVISEMIDENLVRELESRIWVIVLSDRQEKLVISDKDRARLMKKRVEKGEA